MKIENINIVKNDLPQDLLNVYANNDLVAVDCEMMGLNPFRDRLCLVQLCNKNEDVTLVQFDLPKEKLSAPNLKKLFESQDVKKIFHFARTDLAFLFLWLSIDIKNVFCTKSASKLTRTFTDKHGLKDLVKEFLNINLDKNVQTTDWGSRNLTRDQIKYAASDVLYLIPMYEKLVELLLRENRLEIAEEVNKFLPTLAKLDLLGYADFFAH